MQVSPDKIIDAIAALKAAADALHDIAARCIESASALQASVQIAGQTHRTFHATGVH
jgi:uncharacterized protein YukE